MLAAIARIDCHGYSMHKIHLRYYFNSTSSSWILLISYYRKKDNCNKSNLQH